MVTSARTVGDRQKAVFAHFTLGSVQSERRVSRRGVSRIVDEVGAVWWNVCDDNESKWITAVIQGWIEFRLVESTKKVVAKKLGNPYRFGNFQNVNPAR